MTIMTSVIIQSRRKSAAFTSLITSLCRERQLLRKSQTTNASLSDCTVCKLHSIHHKPVTEASSNQLGLQIYCHLILTTRKDICTLSKVSVECERFTQNNDKTAVYSHYFTTSQRRVTSNSFSQPSASPAFVTLLHL